MARAHRNRPVNLTGSALGLHLHPYAPWDSGVCVFVCVTSWFLKHLPGDRLCGPIAKGDTAFLFRLGIEPYFPGGAEFCDFLRGSQPLSQRGPS